MRDSTETLVRQELGSHVREVFSSGLEVVSIQAILLPGVPEQIDIQIAVVVVVAHGRSLSHVLHTHSTECLLDLLEHLVHLDDEVDTHVVGHVLEAKLAGGVLTGRSRRTRTGTRPRTRTASSPCSRNARLSARARSGGTRLVLLVRRLTTRQKNTAQRACTRQEKASSTKHRCKRKPCAHERCSTTGRAPNEILRFA